MAQSLTSEDGRSFSCVKGITTWAMSLQNSSFWNDCILVLRAFHTVSQCETASPIKLSYSLIGSSLTDIRTATLPLVQVSFLMPPLESPMSKMYKSDVKLSDCV